MFMLSFVCVVYSLVLKESFHGYHSSALLNLMLSFGLILTIDLQAYSNPFLFQCPNCMLVKGPGWPKS